MVEPHSIHHSISRIRHNETCTIQTKSNTMESSLPLSLPSLEKHAPKEKRKVATPGLGPCFLSAASLLPQLFCFNIFMLPQKGCSEFVYGNFKTYIILFLPCLAVVPTHNQTNFRTSRNISKDALRLLSWVPRNMYK